MPQTVLILLVVITDVMILVIPLLIIGSISSNLTRVERHAIPFIFLLGILTIIAPLVRYIIMRMEGLYPTKTQSLPGLTMRRYHLLVILLHVELVCAVTAFALPAFRMLLSNKFWAKKRDQIGGLSGLPAGRRRVKRAIGTDTELLHTTPDTSVVVRTPSTTSEMV